MNGKWDPPIPSKPSSNNIEFNDLIDYGLAVMNQLIEIGWPQQIERRREPGGKKWKWKGGKNSHDFPPEFPPPINTPLN